MRHHHRIGLALGSGAARGWAHIGVLRTLAEAGITPDIVAGASIGAAVGAAWCAGRLDAYEAFARGLDRRQVWGYFDLSFRGGLIKGRKVFDFAWADIPDLAIEDLERSFAAVAVDVALGREVWLRQGRLLDCLRASAAIPGIVTPVNIDGRWLIDGGVLNPVPVNVCRAMGATLVIAVDLNTQLAPRHFADHFRDRVQPAPTPPMPTAPTAAETPGDRSWQAAMREMASELQQWVRGDPNKPKPEQPPSMFEVMGATVDIMSTCISRSRLGGDPPDLMIAPRLPDFAMFDFHRAAEAIAEGRRATLHALASAPAEFAVLHPDRNLVLPPPDLGPAVSPLTLEGPTRSDGEP
jgi:NTE family protein